MKEKFRNFCKCNLQRRMVRLLLGFYVILFMGSLNLVQAQVISPYLIGQNAWMPYWFYDGKVAYLWDEIKTANYTLIRVGGNDAMTANKDYTKVISLIDGVYSAGAVPMVQIPDDFTAAQTIAYYNYLNVTMKKGIKYWSIGNEPTLNGRGSVTQIADYIKRISSALKSVDPNAIVMGTDEASFNSTDQAAWLGGYADISGKDAAGNYYIDVYTWHSYNWTSISGHESNVNTTLAKLATVNANRPANKQISWGMTEWNTHWDQDQQVTDYKAWSFRTGQLFAEMYDMGMRKGAFTMTPWCIHESGGDRAGTDNSIFDTEWDFKPRSSYWHSSMLGQNMKDNYLTNTDNQADIKVISMGDASGVSVMIMNTSKTNSYAYSLKLDNGTISSTTLQIKVNANIDAQTQGTVSAYSTQMLVFCPNGTLMKRYIYTTANCDARTAPSVETFATTCETTPAVLTTIAVTPATTTVYNGSSVTFAAQGYDQYGAVIASTPTWTVSGGGTITSAGVFTATTTGGPYTVTATSGTIKGTATVTVVAAPVPVTLPAKIEAENYTVMYGIQTETTTDTNGGLNVGYTDAGDYMDYYVNVPSTGTYTIDFRVASAVTTGKFELRNSAGTALATVSQTVAGDWQGWSTKTVTANLTAGIQTLKIYYTGAGLNINWFEVKTTIPVLTSITVSPATSALAVGQVQQFTATGKDQFGAAIAFTPTWTATGGTITSLGIYTATTAGTQTITATSGTISGVATATVTASNAAPGIIQAENYATMYGIQTETTTDTGGGQNVGWIDTGDYMTYTVNVATAGTYSINFRVAGWSTTGRISIQNAANTTLTSANVPNGGTGAYQVWSTVAGEGNFTLSAGVQTIRIYATGSPWNLNWFEIKSVSTPALTTITVTPSTATIVSGSSQQFTAVGYDQFGAAMAIAPIWSTNAPNGLYTGTTVGGPYSVTASVGTVSGSANVTVTAASTDPLTLSYYHIVDKYTADYMRPTDGLATSVITQYESATVPTYSSFQWEFRAATTTGYYYIVNKYTGYAIYPTGASATDGVGLSQVALTTSNQNNTEMQWAVTVSDEANYYWIKNRKSGLNIRPAGGANGTGIAIVQNTLVTTYSSFKWSLVSQGLKSAFIEANEMDVSSMPVSVYPNPVQNNLKINLNGNTCSTLEILDLTGRVQKTVQINNGQSVIDIDFSAYNKGVYLLKLSNEKESITRKVIKN
jgi:hypothetical protein